MIALCLERKVYMAKQTVTPPTWKGCGPLLIGAATIVSLGLGLLLHLFLQMIGLLLLWVLLTTPLLYLLIKFGINIAQVGHNPNNETKFVYTIFATGALLPTFILQSALLLGSLFG
jgi:hypothetical protein